MAISGPVNSPATSNFSAAGTGTSLTASCPGTTSGNQLYAFVAWATTSGITVSMPSGWTLLGSASSAGNSYLAVYSKTATGSDSTTATFSASVQRGALAVFEYSGSGFNQVVFNEPSANTSQTGPSCTPLETTGSASIYAFMSLVTTPSNAGVATNPTVGTYVTNVFGGTASSYTVQIAFSTLASTTGAASKIVWSTTTTNTAINAQLVLAPLVATISSSATSALSAKAGRTALPDTRATSTVSAKIGLKAFSVIAAISAVTAARVVKASISGHATSSAHGTLTLTANQKSAATSTVAAAKKMLAATVTRGSSTLSARTVALASARTAAASPASGRVKMTASAASHATSVVSASVQHVIAVSHAATSSVHAVVRILTSRSSSATSTVTPKAALIARTSTRATSAVNAIANRFVLARTAAHSTVHTAGGILRTIKTAATTHLTGSFGAVVKVKTLAWSILRAIWINTSDTLGQDEVCYAIEDELLRIFTQATQPGGQLAATSQYAPVAVIEHVVPPEQRIFPNVAVQFRRLEVVPSGIRREDVTAYYDISVAVQQPYSAGQPATIGSARANLAPFVDDGAGNGVAEILRANATLGGLCRRSKIVALEEATLQSGSATAGAIVAAFIVLQCDYSVTIT